MSASGSPRGPRGRSRDRRGLALTIALTAAAAVSPLPTARAQTDDELAGARQLFARGVEDEQAKRFDVALEEFRRVAAVKETANVRYRIATCLEALGRAAEALENYEAAVRLGQDDKQAADTVKAAGDHAAALQRIVPTVRVVLPADTPPGAQVTVDDAPVDPRRLQEPLPVDQGHHTIAVTAPGRAPYRTGLTLSEGARVTITAELPPVPATPPTPASSASVTPVAPLPSRTAVPYVLLGVGAVLAVGSVVSLVLRAGNLSTINADCPNPAPGGGLACPQSLEGEVNSARNAAQVEGPLGVALGIGAGVAVAAGLWWIFTTPSEAARSPAATSVRVLPVLSHKGGALVLSVPIAP
jgi:hypothetical protein